MWPACIVVRTDTGPIESFEVNVGLHQRSVLLLASVMEIDVVSNEKEAILPFEFVLY